MRSVAEVGRQLLGSFSQLHPLRSLASHLFAAPVAGAPLTRPIAVDLLAIRLLHLLELSLVPPRMRIHLSPSAFTLSADTTPRAARYAPD